MPFLLTCLQNTTKDYINGDSTIDVLLLTKEDQKFLHFTAHYKVKYEHICP